MSPTLRVADAVGELVDDQAILVLQRRRHAHALDARDLEAERDDQRGVDGGRRERLQPGDELLAETVQPDRRAVEREARRPRRRAPGQPVGGRTAPAAAARIASGGPPSGEGDGRRLGVSREAVGGSERLRRGSGKRIVVVAVAHNFKYSRSRRVCERLTGISVPLPSFIFRM